MRRKIDVEEIDEEILSDVENAGKILTAFFLATVDEERHDSATTTVIAKTPKGYFEIKVNKLLKSQVDEIIADLGADRDVFVDKSQDIEKEEINKERFTF